MTTDLAGESIAERSMRALLTRSISATASMLFFRCELRPTFGLAWDQSTDDIIHDSDIDPTHGTLKE
jgi:hypothetical protein